ncbi:MAG TPA: hypothetical protein PLG43_12240, partial [Spirochaetia bacterium]|nr:hypothetical protein [Spirochaetia bacterium]
MKLRFASNSRFIGIVLIVLLVGMIVIAGMLIGLTHDMKRQEGILSADNEKNSELIELLKQSVLMLSRDSNQMRSILRLPPTSYPDFREREQVLDSSESTSTNDPGFFKAIEFIEKEQQKTQQVQEFKKIYADEDFIACLKATGLSFVHTEDFAGELRRGTVPYFSLSFD